MLKEIRQYYGIDQGLFADYLGISRSQLSMAEGGRRHIPPARMLQLLPLYKAIDQPAAQPDPKVAGEHTAQLEALRKTFRITINKHQHRLGLLQARLAAMKAAQEKSLQILGNINRLIKDAPVAEANLLKIAELNARKLQRKTGLQHQWKLELKILHLQTELAFFTKRVNLV